MKLRSRAIASLAVAAAVFALFQNCGSPTSFLADDIDGTRLLGTVPPALVHPPPVSVPVDQTPAAPVAVAAKSKPSAALVLLSNPRLIKDAVLERAWNESKPKFREMARSAASDSSAIYNVQMEMSSFLQYAYENRKERWLNELMDIYLEPAAALRETSSYVFFYPVLAGGSSPARATLPLSAPHRMWLASDGVESVLDSSQFLYPVTLLLSWVAQEHLTDEVSTRFVQTYAPVATKHFLRWILKRDSPHGAFEVAGWDCGSGTFSHREFVAKRAARAFKASPSYCNALTDVDLFLLAGTLHLLAARTADPSRIPLSAADAALLTDYARESMRLFRSRVTYGTVLDRTGATRTTAGLDDGAWDDHPDNSYAGDTGLTFPGCLKMDGATCVPGPFYRPPKKASGAGWDVSHGRRVTIFLFSLKKFGPGAGVASEAEARSLEEAFSNQMAYRVFNGDFAAPAFTNYMDGTNGWYRVNYSGRPMNSGEYPPWSRVLSDSVVLGGYFFWSEVDPEWERIAIAAEKKLKYTASWPYYCVQAYASMPPRFFLNRGNAGADGSVCGR